MIQKSGYRGRRTACARLSTYHCRQNKASFEIQPFLARARGTGNPSQAMAEKTTFYRRPLPPTSVAFSSPDGRSRFDSALRSGGCEAYFHLAEQFTTQADPAFCGVSSLVMVLNALSMDPGRTWIGSVWRWYHEDMLDGVCRNLDDVRRSGITLSEFCCMARCHGCDVSLCFATELDEKSDGNLADFRSAIKTSLCSHHQDDRERRFLVCSYRLSLRHIPSRLVEFEQSPRRNAA
jgi:hypothetical protein